MVESMDQGIGEILNLLNEMEIDEETIVIFFSDNGGTYLSNNGPLRGTKGQVYEGGIRVPCIIKWPGNIPEASISHQSSLSFDLTLSILEQVGAYNKSLALDGYDIIEHIIKNKNAFNRTMFWRGKRDPRVRKAIRDGNYKYIVELDPVPRDRNNHLHNLLGQRNNRIHCYWA